MHAGEPLHADAVEEPLRAEETLHGEKPLHAGELLNAGKPLDTEASYLRVPKPHAWRRKDRCTDSGRHNGD